MKIKKQWIGVSMIALLYAALFMHGVISIGFLATAGIFIGCITLLGFILVAVSLIVDEQ